MLIDLHNALSAACPIEGLRRSGPDAAPEIMFAPEATLEQQQAATAILASWNPNAEPPNWDKLQASFRGTPLMGKCFTAAGQDLACNAAFTMLYGSITQTKNLDDFLWSLGQLRAAMAAKPAIGDFTPQEISDINTVLEAASFDPIA